MVDYKESINKLTAHRRKYQDFFLLDMNHGRTIPHNNITLSGVIHPNQWRNQNLLTLAKKSNSPYDCVF